MKNVTRIVLQAEKKYHFPTMCRMLGMAANTPAAQKGDDGAELRLPVWQYLVGAPHALRVQAREGLGAPGTEKGHPDSWGVSWMDSKGEASLVRQTGSAYDSAYFVFASESAARGGAGSGPGRVVIGHLRQASCGAVTSENAHPIRVDYNGTGGHETLMVAHNGTVRKPLLDTLRADLETAEKPERSSDSDTVVLAAWLGAQIEAAAKTSPETSLFDTLAQSLQTLTARAVEIAPNNDLTQTYSSICLLVAHTSGLFVLRQFSKDPTYYTLYARTIEPKVEQNEAGGWVVASELTSDDTDTAEREKWALLTPGVLNFYPANGDATVQTAVVAPPYAE